MVTHGSDSTTYFRIFLSKSIGLSHLGASKKLKSHPKKLLEPEFLLIFKQIQGYNWYSVGNSITFFN